MHSAHRAEHISRWLAIATGLVLAALLCFLLTMEFARVVDVFPPRLARRGLRIAREAMVLLPVLTVAFLAAAIVARQAATGTWRPGAGLGLFAAGSALLVTGLANLLIPFDVFPSGRTCVINYDMVLCHVTPWIGAPLAALLGAALLRMGVNRNRAERNAT